MNVNSWLASHKLDGSIILSHLLLKDPTFFVTHPDSVLSPEELKTASELVTRREAGEPLAYCLGCQDFYGRRFMVNSDVLIPRPESEAIIDLAKSLPLSPRPHILDIGTGSGCLAITLKLEFPDAEVSACDCSIKALAVARKNATNFGVKINFRASDLLEEFSASVLSSFDLIVANLPYVDSEWSWLEQTSLSYEPSLALFTKDQGLFLIKKLLRQLTQNILTSKSNASTYLILEADPSQHSVIKKYAEDLHLQHIKTLGFALLFLVVA